MSPRYPVRRRPAIHRSSYREWRNEREGASIEARAFWRWATLPGTGEVRAEDMLPETEYRVLSKGASGGGFLVPTELSEMITGAARAASQVAQLANEVVTDAGETLNMSLAGTHGTAAWVAESGPTRRPTRPLPAKL